MVFLFFVWDSIAGHPKCESMIFGLMERQYHASRRCLKSHPRLPEDGRGVLLWAEAGKNFPVSVTVPDPVSGSVTVARVSRCAARHPAVAVTAW